MRLSFSTLGCPDWALPRILDVAGREGYDGVELRFLEGDPVLWQRPELSGSGLAQTRQRLRDAALAISCVDTGSYFHHVDAAARRRDIDEARHAMELAAELGAPGIRVFGDAVQPGADLESTRRFIADSLSELAEKAPKGVEVWIESHGDFAPGSATRALLDLVRGPGVGVVWDPANAFEANGEAPEDGFRALGAAVRHVHLKDLKLAPDASGRRLTPALPGTGEFAGPSARILELLARAGYAGWGSFEWEKKWHPQIEPAEVALPHFMQWASSRLRGSAPSEKGAAPTFRRGRLAVEVHLDRLAMGRAAARSVAAGLRRLVDSEGRAAAIFASAPSQNEFLTALRETPDVPWERITAFHLDEYVGLDADHPASFRRFLRERLFDHVKAAAFHGLDGQAADLAAECRRYESLLREQRPGIAVLGIGENGHLAFIDPPVCDFADAATVRQVELDAVCRQQQVHDGAFAALEAVPRTALSLTVPFLMGVARLAAIVPGPAKRAAVQAALDGPLTTACPASILRRHPNATLYLDPASAAGVQGEAP
jgi:glucosamine-6-phosphate deaminase